MVIGVEAASAEEDKPPKIDEESSSDQSVDEAEPAPRRSGPPAPGLIVIVLALIMVLSVVAAFFGAFAYGLGGLQEQRSQHQLYALFRGLLDPSSPIAPKIGGVIPQGTPVALINSPQAGLHDVIVVEGTTGGDLLNGPGHLRDTPLPGQAGESVLFGKGITAGAPFGGIDRLHKGDVITARTGQGKFRFIVEGRVAPGGKRPVVPGNVGLLTLVTSTGSGLTGRLTPSHLIYVEAKLHGKAVAAPRGRPKSVTAAEVQGHNDPAAWLFVGLWSLALVVGTAAFWRLWYRWGLLRTWLIGAPVLFGILWGLSDEAMRLLPNIY